MARYINSILLCKRHSLVRDSRFCAFNGVSYGHLSLPFAQNCRRYISQTNCHSSWKRKIRHFTVSLAVGAAIVGAGFFVIPQDTQEDPVFLNPQHFVKLKILQAFYCCSPLLVQTESVNTTDPSSHVGDGLHRILKLGVSNELFESSTSFFQDQFVGKHNLRIFSVEMKEPSLQISRHYTPLFWNWFNESGADQTDFMGQPTIDLLIKRYTNGELGRYAHQLYPGSFVEIRGPFITWQWNHDIPPEEIVMIAGGTGITPFHQLVTNFFNSEHVTSNLNQHNQSQSSTAPHHLSAVTSQHRKPKFKLLYAVTNASSFLLLPELSALKHKYPDQLDIELWAESPDIYPHEASSSSTSLYSRFIQFLLPSHYIYLCRPHIYGFPLHKGRIHTQDIARHISTSKIDQGNPHGGNEGRIVLICGPDQMIAHLAGPKARNISDQAPLAGVLGSLGMPHDRVYRL